MKKKLIDYNRKTIIEAAERLFSKNGSQNTTVDAIAKEAECSKATIYVYFKSKDDIFYNIVFEYMTLLKNEAERILNDKNASFGERFFALCNSLADFECKYPMYFEWIMGNISISQKDFETLTVLRDIYAVGEEINDIIISCIKDGKEKGIVKKDFDIDTAAFVLWTSVGGIISAAYHKQEYFKQRLGLDYSSYLAQAFKLTYNMLTGE